MTDGERMECEHCGEQFDPTEAVTATFPGLPDLCRCPDCGEWTEALN